MIQFRLEQDFVHDPASSCIGSKWQDRWSGPTPLHALPCGAGLFAPLNAQQKAKQWRPQTLPALCLTPFVNVSARAAGTRQEGSGSVNAWRVPGLDDWERKRGRTDQPHACPVLVERRTIFEPVALFFCETTISTTSFP